MSAGGKRSLYEEDRTKGRGAGRPPRARTPEEKAQRAAEQAARDDLDQCAVLAKERAPLAGEDQPEESNLELISLPKDAIERIKPRRAQGKIIRDWVLYGSPKVSLTVDERGDVVMATFSLGMDVPSSPRMTQNTLWTKHGREFSAWKALYRTVIRRALELIGYPGAQEIGPQSRSPGQGPYLPGETLFGPRLAREPRLPGRKTTDNRPLMVHLYLQTALLGDWDNRVKSVMDAANKTLWPDDFASAGGSVVLDYQPERDPWHVLTVIAPGEGRLVSLYAQQQEFLIKSQITPGARPWTKGEKESVVTW